MNVSIFIPENIVQNIELKENILQFTKEAFTVEAYRKGVITEAEVQELMNFTNRFEVDAFLKKSKAYIEYSEEDLQSDIKAILKTIS